MSLALHLATKFFLSGPLSTEVLSADLVAEEHAGHSGV